MTIAHLPAIPARSARAFPFTSLEHDDIHDDPRVAINALIDAVNALAAGSSLPAGAYTPFAGTVLPAGFLWCNGQVVAQAQYTALYSAIGTLYNTGGEGVGNFRLPDVRAKVPIGTNPMGGSNNVSYSTRTIATVYGAETATYTPAGSVSQASTASITATLGSIDISSLTATSSAINISGVTATLGAINISSLTATLGSIDISNLTSNVSLANGPVSGDGTGINIDGQACTLVTAPPESLKEVMDCVTLTVSSNAIAATLTTNVSVSSATIGGTIASPAITIGGTIPSPSITVGGAIPTPTITIGGSISSPAITVGGTIPVQSFTGTQATIPTVPLGLGANYIIKY